MFCVIFLRDLADPAVGVLSGNPINIVMLFGLELEWSVSGKASKRAEMPTMKSNGKSRLLQEMYWTALNSLDAVATIAYNMGCLAPGWTAGLGRTSAGVISEKRAGP